MTVSVDQLTKILLSMRAKRSELKKGYEEEDNKIKAQMETVKERLLDHCNENNVESVKTEHGTFYRKKATKYWTSDWESMHKFIVENNLPQFLNKQLNQANVREWLEENPEDVPPGLNSSTEYTINVRKS